MNTLGERIKFLINKRNITPYEIEKKSGVSQATLSRLLTGNTKKTKIENLEKLANYFHVSIEWLQCGEENSIPNVNLSNPDFNEIHASKVKLTEAERVDKLILQNERMIEIIAKQMESINMLSHKITETFGNIKI